MNLIPLNQRFVFTPGWRRIIECLHAACQQTLRHCHAASARNPTQLFSCRCFTVIWIFFKTLFFSLSLLSLSSTDLLGCVFSLERLFLWYSLRTLCSHISICAVFFAIFIRNAFHLIFTRSCAPKFSPHFNIFFDPSDLPCPLLCPSCHL